MIARQIDRQRGVFSWDSNRVLQTKSGQPRLVRNWLRGREKKRGKVNSLTVTPTLPVDHSSSLVDPKFSRPRWHFRFSLPPAAPGPSPWSIYTIINVWCSLAHLSISVFTMITRVSLIQRGHLGPTAPPPRGHFAKHPATDGSAREKAIPGHWAIHRTRMRQDYAAETRRIPRSGM